MDNRPLGPDSGHRHPDCLGGQLGLPVAAVAPSVSAATWLLCAAGHFLCSKQRRHGWLGLLGCVISSLLFHIFFPKSHEGVPLLLPWAPGSGFLLPLLLCSPTYGCPDLTGGFECLNLGFLRETNVRLCLCLFREGDEDHGLASFKLAAG